MRNGIRRENVDDASSFVAHERSAAELEGDTPSESHLMAAEEQAEYKTREV